MTKRLFLLRAGLLLAVTFVLVALVTATSGSLFTPASAKSEKRSETRAKDATKSGIASVVSERAIAKSRDSYGRLPLSFEINRGQTDRRVKFLARGQGYGMFLTSTGAVLSLNKAANVTQGAESSNTASDQNRTVVSLSLIGSVTSPRITGVDKLPGTINYFVGNDRRKWRTEVSTYSKVLYQNVYRGIDLVYYGNQHQLEYDFVVSPQADPRRIKLGFTGAEKISTNENGDLVLTTPGGAVIQRKPIAYQEIAGARWEVSVSYRLKDQTVSFDLGAYDKTHALIIDPILSYSTFLGGGSTDQAGAIAVDAQGNVFLTGLTLSTDFPINGSTPYGGNQDAFMVKLNPTGSALVYSTYIGGLGSDIGNGIAIDAQGNAYIIGLTGSGNFPITPGAFQTTIGKNFDGFLTKITPSGSLAYSTFIGGDNGDTPTGIAVDALGRAHVVGRTDSTVLNSIPLPRNGSPVYKSANNGSTWSSSSFGFAGSFVTAFAFAPGNSNIIYAAGAGGIFKTTDAGANWSMPAPNQTQSVRSSNAVAVDPSNPNIIYTGGVNGVFRSTDGGATFIAKNSGLATPNTNALAINHIAPTTLYAGTQLGIFKSTNGGDSWAEVKNGIPGTSPQIREIILDPTDPEIVYIGTSRTMFKSTNGGGLWTAINSGFPTFFVPQITALTLNPLDRLVLYAADSTGLMFKTVNGGASWTQSGNGLPTTSVSALAIDPVTPSTIYAGGGSLYKSIDAGANWFLSSTGLDNSIVTAVAVDPSNPAIVYTGTNIGSEAFAFRFSSSGSALEQLLVFGGNENDEARGVALDASGNPYVIGSTASQNFPVVNAFQSTRGGPQDAFVAKLNSAGTGFTYATYLGGSADDQGRSIAVHQQSIYAVGRTSSGDFPLLNPFRSTMEAVGIDGFVTKFNNSGSGLVFSSYLGGTSADQAVGIALDQSGQAYITGITGSLDFPVLNAPQANLAGTGFSSDAFVTKLSSSGTSLVYSTFLGGSQVEQGLGIAVDPAGNAYVTGTTTSSDFPTMNPFQATLRGPDAFVTKISLSADLSLTKIDPRDPVMVGNNLTYILTVSNLGSDTAAGVVLNDTLPAGVTFVSATASQGSCSGTAVLSCALGEIASNASATVTVVATPQTVGMISNTATVTNSIVDPNPSNNSATQETRVSALPSIAGRVASAAGVGTPGVLMTLTGSQAANISTNAGGFYQFPDLTSGGNYTVTPARQGYVFNPPSRVINNLTADATADFQSVACVFSIAPRNQSFGSGGGLGSVAITAPDSACPWTATSDVPWITITSSATGFGSGTVNFAVAPTTSSRSGILRIGGNVFTVWQEVSPCATPSFVDAPHFPVGPNPRAVATGDFNNDGKPDLVAIHEFTSRVTVVLGNGAGGFGSPIIFTLFGNVERMSVGDFNSDGKLDVAVAVDAGSFGRNVQTLLGDGTGNLTSFETFPISFSPTSFLTVGEFNQDGKLDLIIVNASNQLTIMLGTGTGAFGSQTPIGNPPFQAQRVGVGDFNNDNKQDLVSLGGSPTLLLGNGDGTFGTPVTFLNLNITTLVVGDFNNDGNDDVAGTTFNNGPLLSVILGDGAAGFGAPIISPTGGRQPQVLLVADFNGDGKPDLGSGNHSFQSTHDVNVYLGDGAGSFTVGPSYYPGFSLRDITAGDFNGDGKQDIIALNGFGLNWPDGEFALFINAGAGSFVGARTLVGPTTILDIIPVKFDADNKLDLLVIAGNGVFLFPGTTPGEFGSSIQLATVTPAGPGLYSISDVNHDGKPDLTLKITGIGSFVRVYLNNGAGALTQVSETDVSNTFQTVFDDFNADGHQDLVALDTVDGLILQLGNGAGGFSSSTVISSIFNVPGLATGDFNGDGKRDVIASANWSGCGLNANSLFQVLLGDGAGGFAPPPFVQVNGNIGKLLTYDLNGDGRSDLLATNVCTNNLIVFLANENGGLVPGAEFSGGGGVLQQIALADINGDGKPDLVVANNNNQLVPSTISFLIGDGAGGFSGLTTHLRTYNSSPFATGDFNDNGRVDLAVGDNWARSIALFLNSCPVTFPTGVKFTATQFTSSETDARVLVEVNRSGDASAAATVEYKTTDTAGLTNCNVVNGVASSRCDYATAVGTLRFASGETSKTISIPIVNDSYAEGNESFTITLSNATGVSLVAPASAAVTITDNETSNGANPVDLTPFFVRQQYVDFLGREPDPAGAAGWEAVINNCPPGDTTCDRIHVSSGFFRSPEFQGRGYFVYRFYPTAFGRKPEYVEFIPDLAKVSGFLSDPELEAAKVAFITEFMSRPAFVTQYNGLNNTQYVDTLLSTAGITHVARDFWIVALGNGTRTRAQVLREISESTQVYDKYYNQAFVVMQYFGYLRRDPDALYLNWIAHLDSTGDYRSMINGFMNSLEYRFRFGP